MGRFSRPAPRGEPHEKSLRLQIAGAPPETSIEVRRLQKATAEALEGEGMKEIIEDARIEDRNHFEAFVPRIYKLGGEIPRDIRVFADQAGSVPPLGGAQGERAWSVSETRGRRAGAGRSSVRPCPAESVPSPTSARRSASR
jgi:hypothetical protein